MTEVETYFKEATRSYSVACAEVDRRSRGLCEWAISPNCTRIATDHHHMLRRWKDREHRTLIHLCHECHIHVHQDEHRAYRMGWLIRSKR
jgi:hypothetical protein